MAHGDTRLIPMELQESLLPFRVESLELRSDSVGAGKFRGGLGFRKRYVITSACLLTTNVDRTRDPPWGVQGGKSAQPGCVTVYKAAGGSEVISKVRNYPVKPGDVVVLETGGGGGWGDPSSLLSLAAFHNCRYRQWAIPVGRPLAVPAIPRRLQPILDPSTFYLAAYPLVVTLWLQPHLRCYRWLCVARSLASPRLSNRAQWHYPIPALGYNWK